MRLVEVVAAVDAARADDPHRRLVPLHVADLHRRGVRPQQRRGALVARRAALRSRRPALAAPIGADREHRPRPRLLEVERVLHVARRVIGGQVQRFEVVVVVLGLGTVEDLVAGRGEVGLDPGAQIGQRMDVPDDRAPAGERRIEPRRRGSRGRELLGAAVEGALDLGLQLIETGAQLALLVGGDGREPGVEGRDATALAAEIPIAERLEIPGRRDRGELGLERLPEVVPVRVVHGGWATRRDAARARDGRPSPARRGPRTPSARARRGRRASCGRASRRRPRGPG